MIPFAIMCGNFIYVQTDNTNSLPQEFGILDLAADSFTFRLPYAFPNKEMVKGFQLHFYSFQDSEWKDCLLTDFVLEEDEEEDIFCVGDEIEDFFVTYRVTTEDELFIKLSLALQQEYLTYVRLKTEETSGEMSRQMVGYPSDREEIFENSWQAQRKKMMHSLKTGGGWGKLSLPDGGVFLDHPFIWEKYMSLQGQEFEWWYFTYFGLVGHPLAKVEFRYLYIGNQYCTNLIPDEAVLEKILIKACSENRIPVLVLAPCPEHRMEDYERLLRGIAGRWWGKAANPCENDGYSTNTPGFLLKQYFLSQSASRCVWNKMEVVVNDWGTLQLIREINNSFPGNYSCILGTLLQKRRKDPRLQYWKIWQNRGAESLMDHMWNADFYSEHLRQTYPLSGALFETIGYPYYIADLGSDVHRDLVLPFYQTNTASLCTLRAKAVYGDRGKQESCHGCSAFCQDSAFLYPSFLQMVGRYNSLFAFDARCLEDAAYLESFLEQGIGRILFQFV